MARVPLAGAAAVVVALALLAAAARAPGVVQLAYDSVTAPGQSATQRELAPFSSGLDVELLAATRAIPATATYTIVFGSAVAPSDVSGANSAIQYWLLPRRFTPDISAAQWVIAYDQAPETLGVHYRKVIPLGPDVNAFKVVR